MISYNISIDYVIVDNLIVDKMFVDKIPVVKFTRHNSCRQATGKITVHLKMIFSNLNSKFNLIFPYFRPKLDS